MIAIGLTLAGQAMATTVWVGNGADNDWATVANWTAPGVPTPRNGGGDESLYWAVDNPATGLIHITPSRGVATA